MDYFIVPNTGGLSACPGKESYPGGAAARYDRIFWRRSAVRAEREEARRLLGGLKFLNRSAKQAVFAEYDAHIRELSCRLAKAAREIDEGEAPEWII